jgi:hypothetical protein
MTFSPLVVAAWLHGTASVACLGNCELALPYWLLRCSQYNLREFGIPGLVIGPRATLQVQANLYRFII